MRDLIIKKIKEISQRKKEENKFPISATKFELQSAIIELFKSEFDAMTEEGVFMVGDAINDKYIVMFE